jgi:hypothetical protein
MPSAKMSQAERKARRMVHTVSCLMGTYPALPVGQVGEVKLENTVLPAGTEEILVSYRDALLTGTHPLKMVLSSPYTLQALTDGDGTWMTNHGCELWQMYNQLVKPARGRVLVGGLGLGLVARMLADEARISGITIVEINPSIVDLIGRHVWADVVTADLFTYLDDLKPGQFTTAVLDIWRGTGEWEWQSTVVPLKRKIGTKIKRVIAWQEETMLGQVYNGVYRWAGCDPDLFRRKSLCHAYAFRRGLIDAKVQVPTVDPYNIPATFIAQESNEKNPEIQSWARLFTRGVGTRRWEKVFGKYWDEAWGIGMAVGGGKRGKEGVS